MGDASRFCGGPRGGSRGRKLFLHLEAERPFSFSGAMLPCLPGSYSSYASSEMAGV